MNTEKLQQLKGLLEEFSASDTFGLGEMEELGQIETAIEIVKGAIINNEASK